RRIHVDRDQLVRSVPETFLAKSPYMDEVFLALDETAHVGRIAGFVAHRRRRCNDQPNKETTEAKTGGDFAVIHDAPSCVSRYRRKRKSIPKRTRGSKYREHCR